jgi:hypothetical protein
MGFADLSAAEIAEDCSLPVAEVMALCDRLGIACQHPQTRLALEDVKAILSAVAARKGAEGSESGE